MKSVNSTQFKKILEENKLVLVDFYADWCGPCRMMAPVIEELATELKNKAQVIKIDVDAERDLAMQYGIVSIPTLILFKNSKPVSQVLGFRPKNVLAELVNKYAEEQR